MLDRKLYTHIQEFREDIIIQLLRLISPNKQTKKWAKDNYLGLAVT